VLKAGAAYLPLDKTYDESRIQAILHVASPTYLIYRSESANCLPAVTPNKLDLDHLINKIRSQPEQNPVLDIVPDVAQVLFTSGTTGTPKGVQVSHRNLVNHALFVTEQLKLSADDAVLQFACLGFDACSEEIFPALLSGASIVLRPANLLESYDYLTETVGHYNITLLDLPTSYWNHWVDNLVEGIPGDIRLKKLRNIILGGESISPKHVNMWQQCFPEITLINSYGPTETTVICSWHKVPLIHNTSARISIGLPINNTQFYVLDNNLQPVTPGVTGELFVAGEGVSKGYLHLPDVTAQRFLNGTGLGIGNIALYRTGDLVYIDATNTGLHYIGRADDQVKIRGYQVDLGDIKNLLNAHPAVRQSHIVFIGADGNKKLCFYVQPIPNADTDFLRRELRELLPTQVASGEFIFIEKWPLNSNGKIDAGALAALGTGKATAALEITDKTQQIILDIWQEVLGQQVTDIDASFFELGGHSLQAISLLTKIKRKTDVKLSIDILFRFPSIRLLADQVRIKTNTVTAPAPISPLTNNHRESTREKMFFFPPIGGGIVCYKYLAGLIDHKYNACGIQNIFHEQQGQFISLPEMAKKYLADITSIQHKGPYYLGGWSMGGVLAHAVACLLEARGEQVDLLVLIDAWHPQALPESETSVADLDYKFAVDFIRSMHEDKSSAFDNSLLYGCDIQTIWQMLVENGILSADFEYEIFYNYYLAYKNNQQALVQHQPDSYTGSALLFQSRYPSSSISNPPHKLGWKGYIQDIDVVMTDSDHYGQLTGETAREIAARILQPLNSMTS
jgi:amino acid adenylation domain-containing protein